jgi:hypothetical protein
MAPVDPLDQSMQAKFSQLITHLPGVMVGGDFPIKGAQCCRIRGWKNPACGP